ncbi:hypothetical protein B0T17DRAFT_613194 [Bombardia bombarda]|uniref:S-adenosyl-L-methionine-dependent methyltransferase n=1 Tax=Bombardia bombarda TaxID=252184 RepID=A0AA39XLY4_9PEZI|nr:hypothetical protein B0T17DRAFT_613194 [Bombardia bombarda]
MSSTKGAAELQRFFTKALADPKRDALLDGARRICAPLAARMLTQAGIGAETTTPFKLFDNACGPGVVASELQRLIKPAVLQQQSSILCGDFSPQLVELVQQRAEHEGWVKTETKQIDAQVCDTRGSRTHPVPSLVSSPFHISDPGPGSDQEQRPCLCNIHPSHVTTNIGFHVIPDSKAALDVSSTVTHKDQPCVSTPEAIRVLKPGGTLALTTWHHRNAGWAADLQAAFASFPFDAPCPVTQQTTRWGDWPDVNWVRKALEQRSLERVQVDVFAFLVSVDGAEHFVAGFEGMMDWVMAGSWSEEARKEHGREEVFGRVRDFLEEKYEGGAWDQTWIGVVATARLPEGGL